MIAIGCFPVIFPQANLMGELGREATSHSCSVFIHARPHTCGTAAPFPMFTYTNASAPLPMSVHICVVLQHPLTCLPALVEPQYLIPHLHLQSTCAILAS